MPTNNKEYMRKYQADRRAKQKLQKENLKLAKDQQEKSQYMDMEQAKECGKFRRMVKDEERRDSFFLDAHLGHCYRCQSWYAQQKAKAEDEDDWNYRGANAWGSSDEDKPKRQFYQPDPSLPKADQHFDKFMNEPDDPENPDDYVKGERRGTAIGQADRDNEAVQRKLEGMGNMRDTTHSKEPSQPSLLKRKRPNEEKLASEEDSEWENQEEGEPDDE